VLSHRSESAPFAVGFYGFDLGIVSAVEQNFWLLIPNCDVPRCGGGNNGD
jgi:hypothetical protein